MKNYLNQMQQFINRYKHNCSLCQNIAPPVDTRPYFVFHSKSLIIVRCFIIDKQGDVTFNTMYITAKRVGHCQLLICNTYRVKSHQTKI